jgi:hypothetical protein
MENNENMVEFISGTRSATVSFTNPKHIRKIKELYEEHKEDFKYFKLNSDGSVCAKIPLKWIRISPGRTGAKRELTEEQRQALRERLAAGREKAAKKK